jgi:probable HAF family extracellular repeat protein
LTLASASLVQGSAIFTFTQLDVPGAYNGTSASGINDAGQIVGSFGDSTGQHGFLATPNAAPTPEPATDALVGTGLLLIGLPMIRRRVTQAGNY